MLCYILNYVLLFENLFQLLQESCI